MEKQTGVTRHQPKGLSTVSNGLTELPRNANARKIAKIIVDVNKLKDFPVDAQEIVSWANDIDRLCPNADPDAVQFLMDQFKTDRVEWDKNKGIQNIIGNLKYVKKKEDGSYRYDDMVW